MDMNRLCPGCMREIDAEGTRTGERKAVLRHMEGHETAMLKQKRCPYCGFDAATYRQNSRCLPINTILAGKYLVGVVLGEGGFGITYMGYDLNMETRYRTYGEQGPWTDVYAVCAVFYRMLTGQTPVPAMDRLFQDDLKSLEESNTKVSKSTQAAILKGLAVKKEDRIQTMPELIQALYEGKSVRRKFRTKPALIIGISAACLLTAAIIGGVFQESIPEKSATESDASMQKAQWWNSSRKH